MNKYSNFYRKYRPQNFASVVGQEITVTILSNLIKSKTLHHAYLFSGMQGVGKTTVARIFARAINCSSPSQNGDYCNKCLVCLHNRDYLYDIIEIDGATNNGVEQISKLQSNSFIAPQFSAYKVYIIDEVHMLSKSAFNAFLKLLEEPPKHVIFILATTEVEKIPYTIISRCQHFVFQALDSKSLITLLKNVIQCEKLQFTSSALATIADFAHGSARDSLNILEQITGYFAYQLVDAEKVFNYFGYLKEETYLEFLHQLFTLQKKAVLRKITLFNSVNIKFPLLIEKIIISIKDYLYNSLIYQENSPYADKNSENFFPSPSFLQWSNETLKTILDLLFQSLPYFHYKQLSSCLLFEILILNIFFQLKTKENSEGEQRWAMQILKTKQPTLLKKIQNQWLALNKYQGDEKIVALIQELTNTQPVACSPSTILLQTENLATKKAISQYLVTGIFKELTHFLFKRSYYLIVLTKPELKQLKEQYFQEKN